MSPKSMLFAALALFASGSAAALEFVRQPALRPVDAPTGQDNRYGQAVAADGERVAIAAARASGPFHPGRIDLLLRDGEGWQVEASLSDPDGNGRFGSALALEGDVLVVGAPSSSAQQSAGYAYVFERGADGWVRTARLFGSQRDYGDAFGYSVALREGRVLIGAPGKDRPDAENSGALYVFERVGTAWVETARLEALQPQAGELLGASVAWSADLALGGAVGAGGQGAVLGFARDGAAWRETPRVLAPDGAAGDSFGVAIAADATRLVVGAHLDDTAAGTDRGSVRVFAREGDAWRWQSTLTDDASGFGSFGYAVALSEDMLAVGGYTPTPAVFRAVGAAWERAPSPSTPSDDGAHAVALSGDVLAFGAPLADVGSSLDRGVAVIAQREGDGWREELFSSVESELGTTFGFDLAIDGGRALIGGPGLCAGFCPPTAFVGAGYFFERDAQGAMQPAGVAVGRTPHYGDGYAHAVALRGDRALIAGGGGYDWEVRPSLDVFERGADGRWQRTAQLTDAAGQPIVASDVAIDGDIAVAGDRYDLHLFHRDASGAWRHEAKFPAGLRNVYAMSALALHGDTVALGIASFSGEAQYQGLVYVLSRRSGQWQLEARLLGDSLKHVGFGDELALHGDHLLVGESGMYESRPGGGVLAYERTAAGWESRGRLALPNSERWHAGVALHGYLAFAHVRTAEGSAVHAFEYAGGRWQPAGTQAAAGPRVAFDGETLLVSDFGWNLNDAREVEVFSIRR